MVRSIGVESFGRAMGAEKFGTKGGEMKDKIKFAVLMAVMAMAFLAFGCTQEKAERSESGEAKSRPAGESKKEATTDPTKDNPLVVDKEKGVVKVYTEVNGKYFSETTRHGIVFKDGSNGDKSVLRAYADQNDFYNALVKIGAKPGNTLTPDSAPGTKVTGDALDVKVSFGDKTYDFAEVIKQDPDNGFNVRFGGNDERAKSKNTGCILCLDSCPVGITSNDTWGFGDWQNGKVKFYGDKDKLPEDGSPVIASFSVKK